MTKHLFQHGNSLALIIDKPILKMLGIDKETPLEFDLKDDGLFIRASKKKTRKTEPSEPKAKKTSKKTAAPKTKKGALEREKKLKAIYDDIVTRYKKDLEKLAKT